MDIEEFYTQDERRRHSVELEFGRDWNDSDGRVGVSWVQDTGEVYVMREPNAGVWGDGAGDMYARHVSEHALGVEVLGTVAGRDAIQAVMSGWEAAMVSPDGLAWLRDRIVHADDHAHDTPATPSEVLPDD
ncbi:MAG TPA: hypothetical protein VK771_07185 [Acidimicrobiia bacterium]|jgi:hypothetical protein|nr:hypothetical protein [Acidimicrobiia bacterium]